VDSLVVDRDCIVTPVPLDDDEDDMDIDRTFVLTSTHFKAVVAQDGAEAAGLETTGSAARQSASSASANCSDPIFSGTVVPATAVEFAEQAAHMRCLVGVTEPLVSDTSEAFDEVDPNQVLVIDLVDRNPRPGKLSSNRISNSGSDESL
jgi:hypothetical protein